MKIENSLHAVKAFADANGISYSFGKTVLGAARAIYTVDPIGAIMEGLYLQTAYNDMHVSNPFIKATGTSTAQHGNRIVAVYAPEGWTDSAYAVSLHEIGHIMTWGTGDDGLAHVVGSVARVDDESRAWEWAMAHAAEWLPDMESYRTFALGTYRKAINNHG